MPKSNKFNKSFRAGVHALLQWILDAPFQRASIAAGEQTLWQFDFWSAVSTARQHKHTHTDRQRQILSDSWAGAAGVDSQ